MRLSDIMSAMHLGTYAEVALVIFMAAFLVIGVEVFRRRNAAVWEHARHLPLEPEPSFVNSRHSAGDSTVSDDG